MSFRYMGAITLTPGTPIKMSTAFPDNIDKDRNITALMISQKRGNAGFVFVGDRAMTGEANAAITIPPASASAVPYACITGSSNQNSLNLTNFSVDGTAAEVIQISEISI